MPTPCLGFNRTVCTIRATCSHYHTYRQMLETNDNFRTDWITMPLAAHEQCQHYSETPHNAHSPNETKSTKIKTLGGALAIMIVLTWMMPFWLIPYIKDNEAILMTAVIMMVVNSVLVGCYLASKFYNWFESNLK